jgi:hypothetical protein
MTPGTIEKNREEAALLMDKFFNASNKLDFRAVSNVEQKALKILG